MKKSNVINKIKCKLGTHEYLIPCGYKTIKYKKCIHCGKIQYYHPVLKKWRNIDKYAFEKIMQGRQGYG